MKAETKKQIVESLDSYMQEHGISQNEIGKRAGVNPAYIVAMRKGEYVINSGGGKTVEIADKYFEKIAELIGLSLKKSYWETKPTEQLLEIMSVLEDSRNYGYTGAIIGDTGCGKSYGIELFRSKYPNDVFVITVSQLDNIGDLLDKIIDILKIVPVHTKSRKLTDIIAKLRDLKMDGRLPMLIFDECEYMKQPALSMIKELYEGVKNYCAIVLFGHFQFMNHLNLMRKKGKDGMPQFYRRIKFGIRYLPNIDRKFNLFISGMDKQLCRFLMDNCENYGELHDLLVPAMRESERTGEELNEAFVRKVLNIR
jgi:DNA transposition AAA+ family ATPase